MKIIQKLTVAIETDNFVVFVDSFRRIEIFKVNFVLLYVSPLEFKCFENT